MQSPQKLEMEVYSEASNMPVIRYPGRRFPGVLLQGDSLAGLLANVTSISHALETNDTTLSRDELVAQLSEVQSMLECFVRHYATTLNRAEMPLPFTVDPALEPVVGAPQPETRLHKNSGQQVGQPDTDKAAV